MNLLLDPIFDALALVVLVLGGTIIGLLLTDNKKHGE